MHLEDGLKLACRLNVGWNGELVSFPPAGLEPMPRA
jgi:hypothetical protein